MPPRSYDPDSDEPGRQLERRKGGGGGGGHGGGHSSGEGEGHETSHGSSSSDSKGKGSSSSSKSSGSKSSSSDSSSSSSKTKAVSVSGQTSGRSTATAYGSGGGRVIIIPAGQPFAGRQSGGSTRAQVFGTNVYGSGYPGNTGRGVVDRDFPFVYWPIVWSPGPILWPPYLEDPEYGKPDNTSRPGGPLAEATFTASSGNTTLHVISDNSTVASLISSLSANCSLGASSSKAPTPYDGALTDPQPGQAVQYYRASSVVLTLDGYNDTYAYSAAATNASVPLPRWVNATFLGCVNDTIGEAVPLISGARPMDRVPAMGVVSLLWMLWYLLVL